MSVGLAAEALELALTDVGGLPRLSTWEADHAARGEKVALMRAYAVGDHPQQLTDGMRRLLRLPMGGPMGEFCLNYMDIVIQTLADRLRVSGVDAASPEARTWADDLLRRSGFDRLQSDVHEAALTDGDTFVMVDVDPATGAARLHHEPAFDGENGMLIYTDHAGGTPSAAIKVWRMGEITRVNVYTADRVARYIDAGRGELALYETDDQPGVVAWTMRDGSAIGLPVVHVRNRGRRWQPYGMSEIETAIPVQNALNRTLYSMVMAAELTAFQIRYAIGWQPPADLAPGMWLTISEDAPLTPDQRVELGALEQGELAPYLEMARYLAGEIGKITRTPSPEFMGGDNASGESLKQREIGLLGKARRFQGTAGAAWSQIIRLAARIESTYAKSPPPSAALESDFRVQWADAAIRSDDEVIERALKVVDQVGTREFLRLIAPVFGYDEGKITALVEEKIKA